MSVRITNGIGYSTTTGNRFVDISAAAVPSDAAEQPAVTHPDDPTGESYKWAKWGSNNKLPQEMTEYIESCGILNSIIDHQSRFALGEGVMWAYCKRGKDGKLVVEELADIPEITSFMELNNHFFHEMGWMKDQIGFANGVVRLCLDKTRNKIALFQRDDVTEMRYARMNDKGEVRNIFLSAQWDKMISDWAVDRKILLSIPMLNPKMPLDDLIRRKNSASTFAYTFRYPGWGKKYYSMPLWWANLKWVKIARSVPDMKSAMYENSMRPKYLITIYREFWDQLFINAAAGKATYSDYTEAEIQAKKNEVYDQIDQYLSGASNAGKAVFTEGFIDQPNGKSFKYIEIEPLEDTTKDGGYLPDSAAANSEIAFSMRYNPAILGATMPSGPYTNSQGGSNVREAVAMQIITHEPERQNILSMYRLIRDFNKWNTTYVKPGLTLEPIIPATILTTLDTGSGTKPVMMGAQPNTNGTDKNNS